MTKDPTRRSAVFVNVHVKGSDAVGQRVLEGAVNRIRPDPCADVGVVDVMVVVNPERGEDDQLLAVRSGPPPAEEKAHSFGGEGVVPA